MTADNTVRTFNPADVVITFGTVIFTGYAEGEFVNISREGDLFTPTKGADGGIDRIMNNNHMFEVEITIKQTSDTNDALSGLLVADITANSGIYTLSIADLSGTTVFLAPQAWIKKDPESTFSDSMGNRVWTFSTGIGGLFIGGNTGSALPTA